ncbi:hypothetical protein Pmani_033457 [Petrolisthes manimaculis]|uniref:Uncharacterized protein n=1 Tax=Petrolisthes manimaculis TaxID=1843537 RepID=A0AAE1NRD3_9EUCA|nr:hypothetical protein Pmani_033457 [Petrolisthes manimaculis]
MLPSMWHKSCITIGWRLHIETNRANESQCDVVDGQRQGGYQILTAVGPQALRSEGVRAPAFRPRLSRGYIYIFLTTNMSLAVLLQAAEFIERREREMGRSGTPSFTLPISS